MTQPQGTSGRRVARQAITAATRHLCAGAYLDRKFRDKVIGEVRHSSTRRVPPSYDFDLVAVVHQAWRAWWLEAAGQALILSVLVTAAAVDISAVITAACAGGVWFLGWRMLRDAPEAAWLRARSASARWRRQTLQIRDRERHRELSRQLGFGIGGCAVLIVIGGVAATSRGSLATGVLAAAVLLLLLVSVSALNAAARQVALNRMRSAESLRPAWLGRRLAVIDQQQSCDYVIYRKAAPGDSGRSPAGPSWDRELTRFAGGGKLVHRWLPPLGIQLLRPGEGSMHDREYTSPPFKTHELVEHLKEAMRPVGDEEDPTRLRGFQVSDRLYMAETDVPATRGFLRRPCASAEIDRVIDDPHDVARHYLEIRVSSDGEVVTTIFLRVTIRGRTLSLDFSACALTRTPPEYQILKQYAEIGARAVLRSAVHGTGRLPQEIGGLWRLGLAPWVLARSVWAMKDRTITPHRGQLIGTWLSIREEKAEEWDDAELDKITIYDEMKIIERRVLAATEDFLEARNVETSSFRQRVTNIINSGVLNMGKLEMNQPAVGTGARVRYNAPNPNRSEDQPPSGETT